jgi:hypothetical protein
MENALEGKGPTKAKALRRQIPLKGECLMKIMAKAFRRQSMNCVTVKSKHPLFGQSLEP